MDQSRITALATQLIAAYDHARTLDPITDSEPSFDTVAAYRVLGEIHDCRTVNGWRAVGRKIGFTNRTIWARYGVDQPMWAHMYSRTVHRTSEGRAVLAISAFVQPRIEPEVVFGLRGPVPAAGSARQVLDAVEWVAPGFEIVQSHFPGWRFRAPDCTAAFGLHGTLVVGPTSALDDRLRDRLADALAEFEVTLSRGAEMVERGRGSNVLGSPALALQHLARVLEGQPEAPPLSAGEIVTTGTLTDAWPLSPGTSWTSDYGSLGIPGIELLIE